MHFGAMKLFGSFIRKLTESIRLYHPRDNTHLSIMSNMIIIVRQQDYIKHFQYNLSHNFAHVHSDFLEVPIRLSTS